MKTYALLILLVSSVCFPAVLTATPGAVLSVQKNSDGVTLRMKPGTTKLSRFSPCVVEVTYALGSSLPETKSFSVIARPVRTRWKLAENADVISLLTGELIVRVNRAQ